MKKVAIFIAASAAAALLLIGSCSKNEATIEREAVLVAFRATMEMPSASGAGNEGVSGEHQCCHEECFLVRR